MFPEGNLECQFQTFQNFMEVSKENALMRQNQRFLER